MPTCLGDLASISAFRPAGALLSLATSVPLRQLFELFRDRRQWSSSSNVTRRQPCIVLVFETAASVDVLRVRHVHNVIPVHLLQAACSSAHHLVDSDPG